MLEVNENDMRNIVKKHYNMVYRVALSYLNDRHDAEDITQDVFLKLNDILPSFEKRSAISTWLYRVTLNACHDFYRKKKHNTLLSLDASDMAEEAIVSEAPRAPEKESLILSLVRKLPPRYREVLILREVERMKYAEIAKIIKCPIGTVESRIYKARARLKKMYLNETQKEGKNDKKR